MTVRHERNLYLPEKGSSQALFMKIADSPPKKSTVKTMHTNFTSQFKNRNDYERFKNKMNQISKAHELLK